MAGIPDEKIDEVRHASDLVEVISDYVRLRKQGGRFVGLCPFHNEKSPSFSVDPKNNLYHCFGCKAGGDVFTFIREKEGVGFLDAVRLLADRGGVVLPEEEAPSPEATEKESILAALRFAARFYFEQLGTEGGKRAREYLAGRGFTRESVKTFGIGYAPDSWDALLRAATRAGHKPEILERAGLVKARQGGDGHYDAFRDRVQFPIFSPVGKVLGFGGRVLPGGRPMPDGTEPAKYINTSETPVYHKAEVLYGLKQAKTAIRAAEEAILVEGYADVVALHEAGVQNVVAASGTALTVQQVKLLRSYARTVVLLYDADNAGQMAAARGIHTALDGGLGVYLLTLPAGADPDSFVRQFGGEAFTNLLKDERHDFVTFLADGARRTGRLDTPEGKAAAAGEIVDAVARVKDPVAQDAYLLRAATALGVPDATLRPLLRDRLSGGGRQAPLAPPDARRGDPPDERPVAPVIPLVVMRPEERALLRLMLQNGAPMVEHVLGRMAVEEFSAGAVRGLVEALIEQFEAGRVDATTLLRGDAGEDVKRLAAEVLADRYSVSDNWQRKLGVAAPEQDARPFDAATSAMRLLKLDRLEEAIAEARLRLEATEQAGADTTQVNTELMALNELRRQIASNAFLEWNAS